MNRLFLVLSALLAATACGDDGGKEIRTLEDALLAYAEAYCERLETCDATTPADCAALYVAAICDNTSCATPYTALASLEECLTATAALTCSELEANLLPASCPSR